MRKLAIRLADFVICYGREKEDREIYEYGFQTGLETILSFCICVILAYSMGMIKEGILFFVIFIPLRAYAGGFHFAKYILCLLCSCITFFGVLYIGKIITIPSILFLMIPVLLLCIRLLYPVEHVNRQVDCEEEKFFKKKLTLYLSIDFIIFIMLFFLKKESLLSIILLTLLLIVITMGVGKICYCKQTIREIKDIGRNNIK